MILSKNIKNLEINDEQFPDILFGTESNSKVTTFATYFQKYESISV